ncbi:MAG TPA: hypothetical protein VEK06_01530, partial [Myxococcota bacterium]|nr:hypothetical protein [Myxococcota bacterium]
MRGPALVLAHSLCYIGFIMNDIVTKELTESVAELSQDKKNITIGALIQAGFTLLSRIFGMVREVMISHIFGANSTTDAFFIA